MSVLKRGFLDSWPLQKLSVWRGQPFRCGNLGVTMVVLRKKVEKLHPSGSSPSREAEQLHAETNTEGREKQHKVGYRRNQLFSYPSLSLPNPLPTQTQVHSLHGGSLICVILHSLASMGLLHPDHGSNYTKFDSEWVNEWMAENCPSREPHLHDY